MLSGWELDSMGSSISKAASSYSLANANFSFAFVAAARLWRADVRVLVTGRLTRFCLCFSEARPVFGVRGMLLLGCLFRAERDAFVLPPLVIPLGCGVFFGFLGLSVSTSWSHTRRS